MRFRSSAAVALLFSALLAHAQHAVTPPDFAAATTQAGQLRLAPGFHLSVWAAEPQLSNAVAFSFDHLGRCYIAESHRWSVSIFDITQHTNWLAADMSFHSVADRTAFLEARFAATEPDLLTRDSELIRLVSDQAGTGRADTSTVFATGFNSAADGTAAGVLATGGRVYFANIPNLWSFPAAATNPAPSSLAPAREILATGFGVHIGVSGHDLHGLIRGPDGRIYMSFGDRGLNLTNREGRILYLPDCGGVLRCEPDGRDLSVYCFGLRNPQELAFDDDGNLWTVDNDTAGADPCRVLHLVEDGDYGWRTSYQHMDGFGPWVQEELWKGGQDGILPPAGTVSQGPSGLSYYPGTGFGDRWKGTFLHCDFPAGIVAFTVKPQGASFTVDHHEKFLWGCWPTDVDFGPDGAAYVLDWVAGWGRPMKGRIYRITPDEVDPRSAGVKQLLAAGMTARPENELLELLGHADRRVRLEAQWELASRGPSVFPGLRRTAFSDRPTLARVHAIWAVGQIARAMAPGTPSGDLTDELYSLIRLLDDADERVRGQAAQLLGEARLVDARVAITAMLDDPSPIVAFEATMALKPVGTFEDRWHLTSAQKLSQWLDEKVPKVGRVVSRLVKPNFVSTLEKLAPPTDDPFLRHAHIRHWVQEGTNWDQSAAAFLREWFHDPSEQVRLDVVLTLRRGTNSFLTNLLSDASPAVVIAAGRAIHDVPVSDGFPALAALITRIDCPTNVMSRVIDAAFRLGTPQHAQMLAGFAKRRDVPDWARARALDALADWGRPPALDKVNGLWRPLVPDTRGNAARPTATPPTTPAVDPANPLLDRARNATSFTPSSPVPRLPDDLGRSASFEAGSTVKRNPQPAIRAYLRVANELLDPNTPDEAGMVVPGPPPSTELQLAVLDTAVRLRTKESAQPFYERFIKTNTAPALRRRVVPALAALNASQTADAVKLALVDPDPGVLASAVPYLDHLESGEAVPILARLTGAATVTAKPAVATLRPAQAAFAALGRLPGPESAAVLLPVVDRLLAGSLPAELRADVFAAARQRDELAFKERLSRHEAGLSQDDPLAARRDVLAGGDPLRGAEIFRTQAQVQCLRCHKVNGDGGTVGPALDGIGGKKPREYLLESIVFPNRAFAEGYKPTEGGVSAMPEGLADLLTPLELRDVVEYLATLK